MCPTPNILAGRARVTDRAPSCPGAVLAVILTAYLMIVLDLSIIFTGLPEIGETMGLDPVALSWVHNAYLLSFGGILLLAARLGDLVGRRRMLRTGIALFTVASLGVGVAVSPLALIGARAVQGVGAAILAPSVLSILAATFAEGDDRSRALAWYSMVAGAGTSLGLVLGGIFAGLLSWRIGFLINVPIGIVLWLLAGRVIPESTRQTAPLDLFGAIASTLGMVALVYGIVRSADHGWGDAGTLASLACAGLLLLAFIRYEATAKAPLLPLSLFRDATRSSAYVSRMLFIGPAVAFFYFGTQLMQDVLGYTPVQAGLGFLPMTVVTFMVALALPRITARTGSAPVLAVAFLAMAAGLFWLASAGPQACYWSDLALPMAVSGVGNGGARAPLTSFGVYRVPEKDHGAASGLVNVAHQLGGSIGLGIFVVVFAAAATPTPPTGSLPQQIGAVFYSASFLCAIGLVLTLLFIQPAERRARSALSSPTP